MPDIWEGRRLRRLSFGLPVYDKASVKPRPRHLADSAFEGERCCTCGRDVTGETVHVRQVRAASPSGARFGQVRRLRVCADCAQKRLT